MVVILTVSRRFRYVVLQMREFRRPITTYSVGNVLKNLPRDLDEAYERILRRFSDDEQRSMAVCALRWIVVSRATTTRATLSDAILIDMEYTSRRLGTDDAAEIEDYSKPPFDERRRFDVSDVIDLLAGLVEERKSEVGRNEWGLVDGRAPADVGSDSGDLPASHEGPPGQDSVIVASHFSLVEYLISDRLRSIGGPIHDFALNQAKANFHVAVTCLRYLAFMVRTCELEGFKFVLARFPLTHYTIQNGFWYTNTSGWEKWPLVLCRLVAYLLPRERSSKTFKTLMRLLPPPVKKLKPMPSPDSEILYSISQSLWHVAFFFIEQIPGTGPSSEAEVDDSDSDYLRSPPFLGRRAWKPSRRRPPGSKKEGQP